MFTPTRAVLATCLAAVLAVASIKTVCAQSMMYQGVPTYDFRPFASYPTNGVDGGFYGVAFAVGHFDAGASMDVVAADAAGRVVVYLNDGIGSYTGAKVTGNGVGV